MCNKGAEPVYNYLLQKGADEKKKIYLLIDEIQYLENPTAFIKIIHDHYPHVKLLVSGSSTFEIKKKFKESLVGRTITFELYPQIVLEKSEEKKQVYLSQIINTYVRKDIRDIGKIRNITLFFWS